MVLHNTLPQCLKFRKILKTESTKNFVYWHEQIYDFKDQSQNNSQNFKVNLAMFQLLRFKSLNKLEIPANKSVSLIDEDNWWPIFMFWSFGGAIKKFFWSVKFATLMIINYLSVPFSGIFKFHTICESWDLREKESLHARLYPHFLRILNREKGISPKS